MTLINLTDDVLLHVFKFLNWTDSINLAATCSRMKNLKYWMAKQNHEFDLKAYVEKATFPIENVLPVIGPYIRVAKITEQVISNAFMEKCCNIKSLNIDECITKSVAITFNIWMKKLQIESLSIGQGFENYVEELLDGIEGLTKFVFNSYEYLPTDFFYKNSAIKHLLLILGDDYDVSSLVVLQSLQSLFIQMDRTGLLYDVQKYVKVDNLKELPIYFVEDNWDADLWNRFGKYLVKNAKLDNLKLKGANMIIDKKTFSTLKLFDFTSLWLDVDFLWKDFSMVLHGALSPQLKYLTLQWPLSWSCSGKIGHILKIWSNVEAICLSDGKDSGEHQLHFNDAFFSDILRISDDRPGLKLHIFSSEIHFDFISKRYIVIEGRKCCSCKDSFQLWDGDDCNFSL